MDTELLTDEELAQIKVECGAVSYKAPKLFQDDRHFVARAVAKAQLEKSRRHGWNPMGADEHAR